MGNEFLNKEPLVEPPVQVRPQILQTARVLSPDDITKANQHLASIQTELKVYAGREGYNPYLWYKTNCATLENELKESPTLEVVAKILAIKMDVPSIDKRDTDKYFVQEKKVKGLLDDNARKF